jgi:hypothetical protein
MVNVTSLPKPFMGLRQVDKLWAPASSIAISGCKSNIMIVSSHTNLLLGSRKNRLDKQEVISKQEAAISRGGSWISYR